MHHQEGLGLIESRLCGTSVPDPRPKLTFPFARFGYKAEKTVELVNALALTRPISVDGKLVLMWLTMRLKEATLWKLFGF